MARDRKSTRLNSSHTEIYTLSLHDALPISAPIRPHSRAPVCKTATFVLPVIATHLSVICSVNGSRSEEHTSELQSHRDLHSFPTRRSSDLSAHPAAQPRTGL